MTTKTYEITVRGEIPEVELIEFENLSTVVRPACTVIRGTVADQAGLRGILQQLHGLGLELTDVRRIAEGEGAPSARTGR
jgi:hypothetical protein